jgi:hypothetical protein
MSDGARLAVDCSARRLGLVTDLAMPRFRRLHAARFCSALLLPSVGLVSQSAQAQEQPHDGTPAEPALSLTWDSDDPTCNGDDVGARALRLVTPGVLPRPLRARVDVRREGAEWLVRLQTESGEHSGRRILRAESCAELRQAIALLLAMTMESKGDMLPPDAPLPSAEPPAAAAPPALVKPPSAPSESEPGFLDSAPGEVASDSGGVDFGWFARLDGKAATGLKPGLGLGVGITAGIRIGDVDAGVSATFWPVTRAQVLDRDGRVSVARQNVGLCACWNVWRIGGLVLAPCLAPELTFFRYVSEAVNDTRSGTRGPLASLTATADVRYELIDDRVSLLIGPGVTWEKVQPFQILLRDEPAVEGQTSEVYKTKGFSPRLEIGVDARF